MDEQTAYLAAISESITQGNERADARAHKADQQSSETLQLLEGILAQQPPLT